MTDETGCVVLASASTCDLSFSRPCVGFGMFAFCSPWRYAARCPVPLASDDAEIIPELSSPGMLMTDGCHGAAGITVIDTRLRLIRSPVQVAVLASGCLSACTPLRPAGNSRPQ